VRPGERDHGADRRVDRAAARPRARLVVSHRLGRYGVTFDVPWGSLGSFVVVSVVAGLGAALLPARRASRLNVLNALQYE
jgi:ABC-type lipoprotein release transport system permease subunit